MPARRLPDLGALEVIVAVARLGSMGAAARELDLSQQAVSARVRTVERELGVALFVRSPAGVELTANGQYVIEWADSLVSRATEFVTGVDSLVGAPQATLVVAASKTVSEYLVPAWVVTLTARTDARISVHPMNSADVLKTVHAGNAGLGFIESPGDTAYLAAATVAMDELYVVAAPDHPWSRAATVSAEELAETPMIQREPGSGTRVTFELAMAARGLQPVDPLIELRSVTAIRTSVLTLSASTVLSKLSVADDVAAGRLVRIDVTGLRMERPLRAVWAPHVTLRGPAREFLDVALDSSRG